MAYNGGPADCPKCGMKCARRAVVEAFGKPDGWDFYGEPGARFIRCSGENFVHFYVVLSGGVQSHRLALITARALEPTPKLKL